MLAKFENQNKINSDLKARILANKQEFKNQEESIKSLKEIENKHNSINNEIELLKKELRESTEKINSMASESSILLSNSALKKTAEELEENFRKKTEEQSILEKQILDAQNLLQSILSKNTVQNLPHIEQNHNENDEENEQFYDAKDNFEEENPMKIEEAKKLPENILQTNHDLRQKIEEMTKKLFEGKVAWADQNNTFRIEQEKMIRTAQHAKFKLQQLKNDFAKVKKEYDKIDKDRKRYALKFKNK